MLVGIWEVIVGSSFLSVFLHCLCKASYISFPLALISNSFASAPRGLIRFSFAFMQVLVSALDYPLFAFSSLDVCVAARNIASDKRTKAILYSKAKAGCQRPDAQTSNLNSQD